MTREEQTISNLKKLKSFHNGSYGTDIDRAIKALEQEPCDELDFVQPHKKIGVSLSSQPRIGHWFAWKPEDDVWRTTCSECGEETRTLWNYCPHCGAKMVELQKSEDN